MQSKMFILAVCLGVASAAVWRERNPHKPAGFEDKEGCYIKEINDVIPFGETVTPRGSCYRVTCAAMMDYASCGVVQAGSPNCHVTDEDLTKPYPECCSDVRCDEENNIE